MIAATLATALATLLLAIPSSSPQPSRLVCKPAKPPQGQFSPGNRNPNSPAGVFWINRHCKIVK